MSPRHTSDNTDLHEACSTDLWLVAYGKLPGHAHLLCLSQPSTAIKDRLLLHTMAPQSPAEVYLYAPSSK